MSAGCYSLHLSQLCICFVAATGRWNGWLRAPPSCGVTTSAVCFHRYVALASPLIRRKGQIIGPTGAVQIVYVGSDFSGRQRYGVKRAPLRRNAVVLSDRDKNEVSCLKTVECYLVAQ